jgi:RNA methyltransferase, TrmH family
VDIYYDENDTWLAEQQLPVYAASLHGKELSEIGETENGILLIGNESKGIREEFLHLAKEKITIPRKGHAESLNAAVAAGIILSHLIR